MWRSAQEPDPETWADITLVSDDTFQALWIRAGESHDGTWLVAQFAPLCPGIALAGDVREITVKEAGASAPEHAELILSATRRAVSRYAERRPDRGARLAAELEAALGSTEAASTLPEGGEPPAPPVAHAR